MVFFKSLYFSYLFLLSLNNSYYWFTYVSWLSPRSYGSFSDMQCVFTYMGMTGTFPSRETSSSSHLWRDYLRYGKEPSVQGKHLYIPGWLWFSVGCPKLIGLSRLRNEYSELPIERSFFFFRIKSKVEKNSRVNYVTQKSSGDIVFICFCFQANAGQCFT